MPSSARQRGCWRLPPALVLYQPLCRYGLGVRGIGASGKEPGRLRRDSVAEFLSTFTTFRPASRRHCTRLTARKGGIERWNQGLYDSLIRPKSLSFLVDRAGIEPAT